MKKHLHELHLTFSIYISLLLLFLSACGNYQQQSAPTVIPATPTVQLDLPSITSVKAGKREVSNYETIEFTLDMDAKYSNPYDVREIAVDGVITSPEGEQWNAPGLWDGEGAWKLRFTPSQVGTWKYSVSVTDTNGKSESSDGEISVTPSYKHGWIIPGDSFNPVYSPHYLVYHDGTPFYGVGFCEALNILIDGFDVEDGLGLFDNMTEANANYVVWWPMYSNSIFGSSYNDYSVSNMKVIDAVVKDAEKEDILLVFTIWDHPNLRDETHAWGEGNWKRNGFSKSGDIDSFFVSDDAWAWQKNLYRYIIARWGYSTSIGMWQTVSEINGTNAYDQTDPWHAKVNNYFVEHDPYRHPTTASGSGEVDWPTGHAIMDMPQMHIYNFGDDNDVTNSAAVIAEWTQRMLQSADSPNWVGEFGVPGNASYPELFHNSIWAALGAGASMTPAEWNSGGAWGRMTPEMYADLGRFASFVEDIPLAKWNPFALRVTTNDGQVRGGGIAGQDGGLLWVQDYSLVGASVEAVRNSTPVRPGVVVELKGLIPGKYVVSPYDTWQGNFLDSYEVECLDTTCAIDLPDFSADMALQLVRK